MMKESLIEGLSLMPACGPQQLVSRLEPAKVLGRHEADRLELSSGMHSLGSLKRDRQFILLWKWQTGRYAKSPDAIVLQPTKCQTCLKGDYCTLIER